MRIIRGIWSNQRLVSPGKRVRPTHEDVRDAWLSYLEPFLSGTRVLDLFAGSGSLGLEALSRGAAAADFVDNSPEALHALKANVATRKLKPLRKGQSPSKTMKSARIFKRDAIPFSQRLSEATYDIVFADPPYGSRKLDRIIDTWVTHRFSDILCVEHAPEHAVPPGQHCIAFDASHVTIYHRSECQ